MNKLVTVLLNGFIFITGVFGFVGLFSYNPRIMAVSIVALIGVLVLMKVEDSMRKRRFMKRMNEERE